MPVLSIPKTCKAGEVGLPADTKEAARRVDFKTDAYVIAIETKGYRLAWSRVAHCPCAPVNDQTQQVDPNCTLCKGLGWLSFRPNPYTIDQRIVGQLDSFHAKLIGSDSVVIRGIMTGLQNVYQAIDPVGTRLEGMAMCTVRAENKVGYYDKLVNLDSLVVYSQIVDAGSATEPLKLRYLARCMNLLRSFSNVYAEGTHFDLVDGDIVWVTGQAPASGTRLVAHYLCHPTWRVIEHPHADRTTPIRRKKVDNIETPLPVSAVCKLEWML